MYWQSLVDMSHRKGNPRRLYHLCKDVFTECNGLPFLGQPTRPQLPSRGYGTDSESSGDEGGNLRDGEDGEGSGLGDNEGFGPEDLDVAMA
ncbi:hypothetical protein CTheo_9187 [Ceratobasidium theobromae]|uniref:Uncharacterized protein n=1 Tax=Ceratobasidium theobromae TaxID=1582974 RepID=A0A5N5Q7L0_9AGAM|nr:hypothetical protein CTheo_9187 [Ceratobasidium theobromae]